ncbi:PAP2 superfamily C-terminal-domain-containing protein [Fennellomyces sp. T-0311]|nr:PAP2 superfamily C-terminal-domain-containing protein [Fennellomyces sp. T-0311]
MRQYIYRQGISEHPPSAIAPWSDAWQRIGFIKLRLEPPSRIQSWQDILYIFANHNFLRVILAIIWLILCGFIESFLAQLSDIHLVHDAFPRVANYQIVNYLLLSVLLYTLIVFAVQSPDWTTRWIVLRRWLVIMGAVYIFRGITLVVTVLPSPRMNNCQPPEVSINGSAGARFAFLFEQIGGQLSPCTDNIFSGHTSAMMSCVMVWRVHSRLRRVYSWIAYLIVLAAILMILFTRFHYTVDVILAIYITFTAWYIYLDCIFEASKRTMFAFPNHSTVDLFRSQLDAFDAYTVYEYLTWQPYPLTTFTWLCMYADGLDIRLRALGIVDEHGKLGQQTTPVVDVHEMMSQSLPI